MKYTLKIKPYGENQQGGLINDFDDEEWDLIVDLFERVIRNFKRSFKNIIFNQLEEENRTLNIVFGPPSGVIKEQELDEYIEILCGYNLDNVIYLEDEEYYIRGEIILEEKRKDNFLDRFNSLVKDISPELIG